MSQVDKSAIHDFTTGETVTEAMLDQNTEVLRTAHNDTDNRVIVLENAQAGAMTGIRSGTAFPTSPVPKAGDKFYRTDLETEYTYSNAGVWEAVPFQKNTYTKTDIDTKVAALFGTTNQNSQSYNGGSQMLSATALCSERNASIWNYTDAWHFNFLKGGLYAIDLVMTRSDLLANQQWSIGYVINNDSNKQFTEQIIQGQYGWNQSGGPNLSRVPHHLSRMQRMNAGDYLHFITVSDDGPRSYYYTYRIIRISD